jgi:hypothetical protein
MLNRRESRPYLVQNSNTVPHLCKPEALIAASGNLRVLVTLDWTRLSYGRATFRGTFIISE